MKIRDTRRLGLVEVEIDDEAKRVVLTLHPPGGGPVVLPMEPEQAFALGTAIRDASAELHSPQAWEPIIECPADLKYAHDCDPEAADV